MPKDNRSFFEKLAGDTTEERAEEHTPLEPSEDTPHEHEEPADGDETNETMPDLSDTTPDTPEEHKETTNSEDEGQLTVDVYQTPAHVVVLAPMAGVKPDDIDVSVDNGMITVRGKRDHRRESRGNDYYYQEVFWGNFSRSILLPEEVDSDRAEASFKNGLLTIKLPKINKDGTRSVKIRAKEV